MENKNQSLKLLAALAVTSFLLAGCQQPASTSMNPSAPDQNQAATGTVEIKPPADQTVTGSVQILPANDSNVSGSVQVVPPVDTSVSGSVEIKPGDAAATASDTMMVNVKMMQDGMGMMSDAKTMTEGKMMVDKGLAGIQANMKGKMATKDMSAIMASMQKAESMMADKKTSTAGMKMMSDALTQMGTMMAAPVVQ